MCRNEAEDSTSKMLARGHNKEFAWSEKNKSLIRESTKPLGDKRT